MKAKKNKYKNPEIVTICLDNDIALQLASDVNPLGEPDWLSYNLDKHTVDKMV